MPRSVHSENYAYDLVYDWDNLTHFDQVLALLPSDWKPDLVIWWDILYQSIPPGLESCPYPTALIPGDWNLGYLNTLHFSDIFDIILADIRLKHYLEGAGKSNLFHWPGFSFDPQVFYREPEIEHIYDICFIGNLNEAIHPQRSQLLNSLLQLKDRYRLFIRQGIWGEHYRKILNQSRIVFNFTIAQVMNMRAYEAPACGALLFIEEENQEIRNFLSDKIECIYYNTHNLIDLLEYYLNHEEERARIAEAGYQKIQNFSYERQFQNLLVQLPEILSIAHDHQQRRLSQQPLSYGSRHSLIALQQFYCSHPQAHTSGLNLIMQRFQDIQEKPLAPETLWELNAIGSLLFPLRASADHPLLLLASQCFAQGLQLAPDHPVFHYHLALCLEVQRQEQQALWHYSRCVELLVDGQNPIIFDYRNFILPFFKTLGIKLLSLEWEKASFEEQAQVPSLCSKYIRLLVAEIWHRIGKILKKQGRLEKAIIAFKNALENYSDIDVWIHLIQTELLRGEDEIAWNTLQQARKEHPFIISHLMKLLNPILFNRHAESLQTDIQPFLGIFDELLILNTLLHIQIHLTAGNPSSETFKELIKSQELQAPEFFQALSYFMADQPHLPPLLKKLIQSCPVYVVKRSDTPEDLDLAHPFFSAKSESAAELILSYQEPPHPPHRFLRSLNTCSKLHEGLIGPELLPFQFVQTSTHSKTEPAPELQECFQLSRQTVLLLLDTLCESELKQCLHALEALSSRFPDTGYLLWATYHPGQVQLLCEQILQTAQVCLFEERLSPQETQWLLQHAHSIVMRPQDKGLFYAAWSLYLGKPICLIGCPQVIPWPGEQAWQLAQWQAEDYQHGIASTLLNPDKTKNAAETGERIRELYRREEQQSRLKALWKLRLYALELLDG